MNVLTPIWPDFADKLRAGGIDVVLPAVKSGLCFAPYAVVCEGSTKFTTRYACITTVQIHLYVPASKYPELPALIGETAQLLMQDYGPPSSVVPRGVNGAFEAHAALMEYTVRRRVCE